MGNPRTVKATGGTVTVALDESPVYIEGARRIEAYRDLVASVTYDQTPDRRGLAIVVPIENRTAAAVRCQGTLQLPPGLEATHAKRQVSVPARSRGTLVFPLATPIDRIDTSRRHDIVVTIATSLGTVLSASGSPNLAVCRRATAPPALDGTPRGWDHAVPLRLVRKWQVTECLVAKEGARRDCLWQGPQDVSARAYTLWDDRFLYLRVDVTDNVFAPWGERSFAGFSGDAIEFAFQPDGLLRADAPMREYETFLAPPGKLLPGGKTSGDYRYKPFTPPGQALTWRHLPGPCIEITDWQVCITRLERAADCRYQLAIPWSAIRVRADQVAKPGRRIGFSLVVDDNDAQNPGKFQGARRWITWFAGIATDKNPSKYGDLLLVE